MTQTIGINPVGLGSLTNAVMRQTAGATPAVGMGATILMWTDRAPATIIAVSVHERPKLGDYVDVVRDDATPNHRGLTESQDWTIVPSDPAKVLAERRPLSRYTWRKNGRWVARGQDSKSGEAILIGVHSCYRDPSF